MKTKFNSTSDLSHMNHREVLVTSRAMSGKTNGQVAQSMGLGEETVARYQREPNPGEHAYDLPLHRVRSWCQAVGNDLLIRWLTQQCGGVFAADKIARDPGTHIADIVDLLNHETADVIQQTITSLRDGKMTQEELQRLHKELRDVVEQGNTAMLLAERMMETKGVRS